MKRLLLSLLVLSLIGSGIACKKQIEQKKEDIIMSAITDGIWVVDYYLENTSDITTNFTNYDFQFYKDGKVTGTKSGNITNGTWAGDAINYTITSNFASPNDTLTKMNGVWKLTDTYLDYVEAERTTASGKNILYLRKKP